MKVLYICPAFPPRVCGVGNYTAQLIRAISGPGIETSLLTGPDRAAPGGYGISRLHTVSSWKMSRKKAVRECLLAERPDLVHIQYQQALFHPGWLGLSLPSLIKKWLPAAKVVITQHDLNYPYLFRGAGPLGLRTATIFKRMWEPADAVIIGYRSGREQMERILPDLKDRISLIPIGPGLEIGAPSGFKPEICGEYGLNPGAFLLASFGFVYRDKDFPTIFKAMSILKDRGRETSFLHAGSEGEERTYLSEMKALSRKMSLGANVAFTGELENSRIGQVLGAADAGLLIFTQDQDLGRHSTLPLMLQLGKPLVVTSAGPGETGETQPWLAVPAGSAEALAGALETLFANRELARRTGGAALDLYKQKYSPQSIGERTIEIYRKILAR